MKRDGNLPLKALDVDGKKVLRRGFLDWKLDLLNTPLIILMITIQHEELSPIHTVIVHIALWLFQTICL